jgi:hypothetical protein
MSRLAENNYGNEDPYKQDTQRVRKQNITALRKNFETFKISSKSVQKLSQTFTHSTSEVLRPTPRVKLVAEAVEDSAFWQLAHIEDPEEKRLDKIDHARHLEDTKCKLEQAKKKKDTRKHRHKSFDDELLREMYDDFRDRDHDSSGSECYSFPPRNLHDILTNLEIMTNVSFLADKVKSKF